MGAAIIVVSRARRGIFENSAATGSKESGCLRAAPLGAPVVPEVRITTRPFSAGGLGSVLSPRAISSSSSGSDGGAPCSAPCARGSLQAMKRMRDAAPSRTSSANSSS